MDVLETIIRFGLSVRHIPLEDVSVYEMRHFREGDQIIERHGRQMCRRTRIPQHAGYWMCKVVNSTSSRVEWNSNTDHLAPTLEESVTLFLKDQQ